MASQYKTVDGMVHVKTARALKLEKECEYPDDSLEGRRKHRKDQIDLPPQPQQTDPRLPLRPTDEAGSSMVCAGARFLEGRPVGPLYNPKMEGQCTDGTGCVTPDLMDASLYDPEMWTLREYNANERPTMSYVDEFGRKVKDHIRRPEPRAENVEDKRPLARGRGGMSKMMVLDGGVDMTKSERRRDMTEKTCDMRQVVAENEDNIMHARDVADGERKRQLHKSKLYALRVPEQRKQLREGRDNTLTVTARDELIHPQRVRPEPKPKTDIGWQRMPRSGGRPITEDDATSTNYDPRQGVGRGVQSAQIRDISMVVARRDERNHAPRRGVVSDALNPHARDGEVVQVDDNIAANTARELHSVMPQRAATTMKHLHSENPKVGERVAEEAMHAREQRIATVDATQNFSGIGDASKRTQSDIVRDRISTKMLGDAEKEGTIDHGRMQHEVKNAANQNVRQHPSDRRVFTGTDHAAPPSRKPAHAVAVEGGNAGAPARQDQLSDIPAWLCASKDRRVAQRHKADFLVGDKVMPSAHMPQTRETVRPERDAEEQTIVVRQPHVARPSTMQTTAARPVSLKKETKNDVDHLKALYTVVGSQGPDARMDQTDDGIKVRSIRETRQAVDDTAHQTAVAAHSHGSMPKVRASDHILAGTRREPEQTAPRKIVPTAKEMRGYNRADVASERARPSTAREAENVMPSRAPISMRVPHQTRQHHDVVSEQVYNAERVNAIPQRAAMSMSVAHQTPQRHEVISEQVYNTERPNAIAQRAAYGKNAARVYSTYDQTPQQNDREDFRTECGLTPSRRAWHPSANGMQMAAARQRRSVAIPACDDDDEYAAEREEREEALSRRETCRFGQIGNELRAPSPAFPMARTPQRSAKRG